MRTVLFLTGVVLLAGCTTEPSGSRSGPGAGELPRNSFPMSNARVVSQAGTNTAIVEVTRPGGLPGNESSVRQAARTWCGGPAQATRVAARGTGVSSRNSYLIRCG